MSGATTELQLLRAAYDEAAGDAGRRWLSDGLAAVRRDRRAIRDRFPAAGRKVGRGPLHAGPDAADLFAWTVDDAARVLLLAALGEAAQVEIGPLYRHGDAAERRAVLRALHLLRVGDAATWVVEDALRTNDLRLVAAALGPYALQHLDEGALNQAALKCAFVGIPLDRVDGLELRANPELSRMLVDYARERVAAGRDVPGDIWPLVELHPCEEQLALLAAELEHPVAERREAARAALEDRRATREP